MPVHEDQPAVSWGTPVAGVPLWLLNKSLLGAGTAGSLSAFLAREGPEAAPGPARERGQVRRLELPSVTCLLGRAVWDIFEMHSR